MKWYPPETKTADANRAIRATVQRWFSGLARRSPVDSGGVARIQRRHIYILPTGMGVLLGVVLMLMLLGSLNYQNNLGLLLTFLLVSVAIVAMFHTWLNLLDLRIAAQGGSPVFAGQDATFSFLIEEDRMRPRGDLVIRVGKQATKPMHLDRAGSRSIRIALPTINRGRIAPEGVRVETRYPLGLFRAWSYPQTNARVTVYPRPAARSPAFLQLPTVKPNDQGDLGMGADDFVGPRDYRPGDSLRRLDWKALARERGLVVKQFGGDRAAQVWIDWDQLPALDTETRLSLLCRQVLNATKQGLSYGLRLPRSSVPAGRGEIHKHLCLKVLSGF
ncbi:MAG: DUF58 domain-containing protein [Chromatiaceae bacterium]|nr:DUF58 domain-containing protein [Chromatiaceae bacterium]